MANFQRIRGEADADAARPYLVALMEALAERGESMAGCLNVAATDYDTLRKDIHWPHSDGTMPGLAIEVLVKVGADWETTIKDDSVSREAKELIFGQPRVKRKNLMNGLAGSGAGPSRSPKI